MPYESTTNRLYASSRLPLTFALPLLPQLGWTSGQLDQWIREKEELVEIPATVPIVVGIVLAVMVVGVIVAYFVGNAKQRKKEVGAWAEEGSSG